jgi:transcription-repair coupling factor (superfamily II helicase)
MLPRLVSVFRSIPAVRVLERALPRRQEALDVCGLPGSSAAVLVAALNEDLPHRVLLVVASNPTNAELWYADLQVLLGEGVRLYPQREALGEEEPHFEIAGERVETIDAVLGGTVRVLVTTLIATAELTRMAGAVELTRINCAKGTKLRLTDFVDQLASMGYERRPSTLDVAQFAVRGGIVDVYGFGMAAPARIEWWGDEIVSLREFDLDSQRSEGTLESVTILPVHPKAAEAGGAGGAGESGRQGYRPTALPPYRREGSGRVGKSRQSLLDLLPPDTLLLLTPDIDISEVKRFWDDAEHHLQIARRRGEDVPGRDAVFHSPPAWAERWSSFGRINLVESAEIDFGLSPPPEIRRPCRESWADTYSLR